MSATSGGLRALVHAAREAGRAAARRPLLPVATFGTLALCLTLTGLFALIAWNLGRAAESWAGTGQMTIYLEENATTARSEQLMSAVRHLPGVIDASLVSSKTAHARLRTALGARGELLDGVEDSFLPASIEVRLRPGTGALLRTHPGYSRLAAAAGVEEIDLHAETAERLELLRTSCVRAAIGLGLLIVLVSLYLVGATIRLGVHARREELLVLRLVGATEWFVRAPFLLEGALVGALGAIAAAVVLRLAYTEAAPSLTASLGNWLAAAPLSFFPPVAIATAVLAGGLLGLVAAGLAVAAEAGASQPA